MNSEPQRIAQLANFVGPTSGGLRRAVDSLGLGYVSAGCARLLVIPGPRDATHETPAGTLVEVRAPRVTGGYRIILTPWKVIAAVRRFAPTSVEVSDKWTLTPAARWARRHGVGTVLLSHERLDDMASLFLRSRLVAVAIKLLNRRLAKAYDRVVVTSDYSRGEWEGTSARPRLVPLGVDLDTFQPPVSRSPREAALLRCVHVGRMSREKSPQLAIAAVAELHRRGVPVRLDVYGTGPHLQEFKALAAGAPVHFHGYAAGRDAIVRAYGEADVSLSVCPAETFGLAVLEALACGTPVVTADRGGASELVDASCSERGEPDPAAIADAISRLGERLLVDEAGIRRAARLRAERYPWAASVAGLLELHAEVAQGGRA